MKPSSASSSPRKVPSSSTSSARRRDVVHKVNGQATPLKRHRPTTTTPSKQRPKVQESPPPDVNRSATIRFYLAPLVSLIARPLRLVFLLLSPILSPFIAYLIGSLLLIIVSYIAFIILKPLIKYFLLSVFRLIWNLILNRSGLPSFSFVSLTTGFKETRMDICAFVPVPLLCTSLSMNGSSFGNWGLGGMGMSGKKDRGLDISKVARVLHKEVIDTRDIFESVASLGSGGLDAGLYHTKIWELATTIQISSNLPDKQTLGSELRVLGDLSRDLGDDIARLYAQSNSAFRWIIADFDRLFQALTTSTPSQPRPSDQQISSSIHSLMLRIQRTLDELYLTTEKAVPRAYAASELGSSLLFEMRKESVRLEGNIKKEPIWKWYANKGKALAIGESEPNALDILHNDLNLAYSTIDNLREATVGLETTRSKLLLHREYVGQFSSGLMGFHLGTKGMDQEEAELFGPEVELNALRGVLEEMKMAVGRSGNRGRDEEIIKEKESKVLMIDTPMEG